MKSRKHLVAAAGLAVLGLGASVDIASAKTLTSKELCQLADKALRSGSEAALQRALNQFPKDSKKVSETLRTCRAKLIAAITEMSAPAAGRNTGTPPATNTASGNYGG